MSQNSQVSLKEFRAKPNNFGEKKSSSQAGSSQASLNYQHYTAEYYSELFEKSELTTDKTINRNNQQVVQMSLTSYLLRP